MNLKDFFNPQSVVIIGASHHKEKLGRQILDNLLARSFKGNIYPVNPSSRKMAGLKVYSDVFSLPKINFKKTLVVIAIPAKFVVSEVEKCAQQGIKNIVIISAGFKESNVEGRKWEQEIVDLAQQYNLNILGPNCLGFINLFSSLNATFTKVNNKATNIALLSQSGAVGSAALDWLEKRDLGVSYFLSLGNKAVLNENDILEYLKDDSRVDLILLYLEEISQGKRLMELISQITKIKPVLILKAGKSEAGKKLTLSHTGSLAGSNEIISVGLNRAGAIQVNSLGEMLNFCLLAKNSYWRYNYSNLYLITNAGGLGVLTADAIGKGNFKLKKSFDILGDAPAERYENKMKELLSQKQVYNVLVLLTPQTTTEPIKTAQAIIKLNKQYDDKLIMVNFVGGTKLEEAKKLLNKHKIPSFDFPEEAIQSYKYLVDYRKKRNNTKVYLNYSQLSTQAIINLNYIQSFALLKKYGIKTVSNYREENINKLNYPVVVKIVGPDFLHKSDKKAVVLGVKNKKELQQVIYKLKVSHKTELKNKDNYIIIQSQIKEGIEVILGIKKDESFGHVILVGLGGIYTEVFKEVKMEIADFNIKEAKNIIASLKFYSILKGVRGNKGYAIDSLAQAMVSLVKLSQEHPEIKELDINPVFVTQTKTIAGDVRIIV